MAHITPFNLLAFQISDQLNRDHYFHVSTSGLTTTSNQAFYMFGGLTNSQVRKQLNWDILASANQLWIEIPGYTYQSGVMKAQLHHLWFDSSGVNLGSAIYYVPEIDDEIAGMDVDFSDWAQHTRIGCLQPHADLVAGGPGASANLFYSQYFGT